jgi:hypothetical protein
VIKAISQKGDNMYQSFKVIKTEPVVRDGQQYVLVDFKYELLTGAGFIVDRRGVASVTSQGNAVEVLWAATISQRYAVIRFLGRINTSRFLQPSGYVILNAQVVSFPLSVFGKGSKRWNRHFVTLRKAFDATRKVSIFRMISMQLWTRIASIREWQGSSLHPVAFEEML